MTHNELAEDLARHVRGERTMTWTDLQLGPSGSVRPDVLAIDKSYVAPNPRVWEVKVSVADFRADVTAGKWMAYLKHAGSVTFACESGLIKPADVPPICGLTVRGDTGWRTLKKATPSPVELPRDTWLKLLIDGIEREGLKHRQLRYETWKQNDGFLKRYGHEAARFVADAASVQRTIDSAEYQAQCIIDRAKNESERIAKDCRLNAAPLWAQLLQALDLPPEATVWTVRDAVTVLKNKADDSVNERAIGDIAMRARMIAQTCERLLEERGKPAS